MNPKSEEIRHAAQLIREGKLVAFPTETVYGLGANALDVKAVSSIFTAKNRPSTSPLIVHVAEVKTARELVTTWPEAADELTARWWPGPLTLVLPKRDIIPGAVTAGLPTVGIRMPNHPVALALIRAAQVPIAAPSANIFAELSPTRVSHLRRRLTEQVDYVLDGGPSPVGIESTVLSLATEVPTLLRPGAVSKAELEEVIGKVEEPGEVSGAHPSPGMHHRHYSPQTDLHILSPNEPLPKGKGVFLSITRQEPATRIIQMPADAAVYAACLYSTLHDLDDESWDWIAAEAPPESPEWDGVRDRLTRAAT